MHYPVGYNRSLMIILLVAYIIRVGRCSPVDSLSSTSDATAAATTDAKTDATTLAATNQSPPATDDKPSMFSKCTTEVYKSLSTLGDGLGLVLKSVGQATLSVMGALFGTYNSLMSVTAKTGEVVATGLNLIDNAASNVVLVNTVTHGTSKLADGFSLVFSENTKASSNNRVNMYDKMVKDVDEYDPKSKTLPNVSSTDDKSADSTTATKTPLTDENSKTTDTTTVEAAQETTTST